ncbi:putative pectinesterase 63 [Argentina anserina]|uniref:putative pectinesterase 63 n=1 Tax=Argentina anserina TaxID=57926 RepID=UPI002176619B|nr:putative pectinesterase 63 [Potentilla anserina]
MALKPTPALLAVAAFLAFHFLVLFVSGKPNLIPENESDLDDWIVQNMREYTDRKAELRERNDVPGTHDDKSLASAEDSSRVIRVKQDGTGDFKTVTDALRSIPTGNKQRVVVWIGGGEYREKVLVDVTRPYVTFYGDKNDMPTITFDGTAEVFGTWNSATVAVEADYFMAVNIAFVNSAPMPDGKRKGAQAVALRISGDKAAFHNCRFIGYQDTLCDDKGRHFFKDCFIQGTVDFIFGNGKSLYLNSTLNSVSNGSGVITAHGRTEVQDDSGFSFVYCDIKGTGKTLLGRAWRGRARVVFSYTYMGDVVSRKGWSDYDDRSRANTVYYGEYKCSGPGSSATQRVKFARMLTDAEAKPFLSLTFIRGTKWVLPPPNL